jgi:hypothetical protein
MFKWRERDCYVHRDRNNVTPALAGVDLAKEECHGSVRGCSVRYVNHAPGMPPQKFKRRYKAKWVGGKKYTFNPARRRRNLMVLCVAFLGLWFWGIFWWLWARGMTNPPTM